MNKIFKLWRRRVEIKISKLVDDKRVEFLSKELIKAMNVNLNEPCNCIRIWTHNLNGQISIATEIDEKRIEINI